MKKKTPTAKPQKPTTAIEEIIPAEAPENPHATIIADTITEVGVITDTPFLKPTSAWE